jgi:hypothetical protein
MSYSVNGSGHGVDGTKAKQAFAEFVGKLDEATRPDAQPFMGSISGSEPAEGGEGYVSFSLSAEAARSGALEAEGQAADEPS